MSSNPLTPDLHHAGVIIISVAGFVSLTSILSLLSYLSYRAWRSKDGPTSSPLASRSQFGALYSCLIFADTLQSISFISSLGRLSGWPQSEMAPPASCVAQAVFLNAGDVGSACFNICIALHTVYVVLMKQKPPTWAVALAICLAFAMMLVFTVTGPFTLMTAAGGPFFADTGFWCWINKDYPAARLYFHYVWVFAAALISVGAYGCVFVVLFFRKKFKWSKEQEAAKKLDALAKSMLLFPVIYIINITPLAVARCLAMADKTVPWPYLLAAGTVFALNGCFNVILFSHVHHFINFRFPRRRTPSQSTRSMTAVASLAPVRSTKMKDPLDALDDIEVASKHDPILAHTLPVLLIETASGQRTAPIIDSMEMDL